MQAVSFPEALKRGYIIPRARPEEINAIINPEPKADIYGLRFPEKHAGKPEDYMRLSMVAEDELFRQE